MLNRKVLYDYANEFIDKVSNVNELMTELKKLSLRELAILAECKLISISIGLNSTNLHIRVYGRLKDKVLHK